MSPELISGLLTAVALGLVAGLVLRLLRRFGDARHLRFWVFIAVLALSAYNITAAAGPDMESFLMEVFLSISVILAANAILQLVNVLLWDYFLKRRRQISIPRLIIDVINFAVLAIVAVNLLKNVFHVDLNALLVTSTVLSAVVGLSLQDVLGSVVAGLALQMEKPFAVGDWVEIDGEEGQVVQMSWRTISLRTRNAHMVIHPNSSITKQKITNLSRITPFMAKFTLGIAYPHPPGIVKNTLLSATREIGGIRTDPPPQVFLKSYDDFSIDYEVRLWMDDYSRKPAMLDAVATRIWYALKRAGIEIPFPVRDVNVRMIPEDLEKKRENSANETIYAELRSIPLFEGLSDEQIGSISISSSIQRFSSGESLVVQGETGDSMFLVKSGKLRVEVSSGTPASRAVVAMLGVGDFFGEMSLLTGEPRSASVIAEGDTEVIRLTKLDFASVISTDTNAVEVLSAALEERLRENAERIAKDSGSTVKAPARTRADIISKIRGFFGI